MRALIRYSPLVLAIIFIVLGICVYYSPVFRYRRFMYNGEGYYIQIAKACTSILVEHPVSSNDVVRYSSQTIVPFAKRIPGNDPSLPAIVAKLHPEFVLISTNFVSILIPPERQGGFGVIWHQNQWSPGTWELQVDADGELETVYSMKK